MLQLSLRTDASSQRSELLHWTIAPASMLPCPGRFASAITALSKRTFNFGWHPSSNGEGGIWTLAPLLTTCTLSRGVPSTSWVLLQTVDPFLYIPFIVETIPYLPAERVGFEPTRPCGQTVFKTASLWPLRYLSKSNYKATDEAILFDLFPSGKDYNNK